MKNNIDIIMWYKNYVIMFRAIMVSVSIAISVSIVVSPGCVSNLFMIKVLSKVYNIANSSNWFLVYFFKTKLWTQGWGNLNDHDTIMKKNPVILWKGHFDIPGKIFLK